MIGKCSARALGGSQIEEAAPDGSSWNSFVEKGEKGGYVLKEAATGQEEDEERCDQTRDEEEAGSAEQMALVGVDRVTESNEEAGNEGEVGNS